MEDVVAAFLLRKHDDFLGYPSGFSLLVGRWEGGLSWAGMEWAAGSRMCYGLERSRMSFSSSERKNLDHLAMLVWFPSRCSFPVSLYDGYVDWSMRFVSP